MIGEFFKKLLLATAAFLLPLVLLELYFYIVPLESYPINDPSQYAEVVGERRYLVPRHTYAERYPPRLDTRGYYQKKDEGLVSFHSDGFGARWIDEHGQNVAGDSVVALGDSFTYGVSLRYEDAYLYLAQQELLSTDLDVSIFNFSRPGANSRKILKIYREIKGRVPHQLVLYGFHINDVISFGTSRVALNPLLDKPLVRFSRVARFIAQRLDNSDRRAERIAYLNDPQRFRDAYFASNVNAVEILQREVAQAGRELRIVLLPILVDIEQKTFDPLYERLRAELEKREIPYVDLTGTITSGGDPEWWVLPLDQHPNELANALFARQLAAELLDSELFGSGSL